MTDVALKDQEAKPEPIWIRPGSDVRGVAGLITSSIHDNSRVTLRAIGAGAVNQALKGIIQARQQLASQGDDLVVRPGFATVKGETGEPVTAIVLHCLLL
jgi:stage V sporulation protein S